MLIDRTWYSSILDVRPFRGAECDTDHYLVVEKVKERLAVSKDESQNFDVEIFNSSKQSELEVKKQYQFKISYSFAASEKLNDSDEINRYGENI
jgi:hypothetical protein